LKGNVGGGVNVTHKKKGRGAGWGRSEYFCIDGKGTRRAGRGEKKGRFL